MQRKQRTDERIIIELAGDSKDDLSCANAAERIVLLCGGGSENKCSGNREPMRE